MIDETKIMQYADGTLPQEEHEEVKKAIEADPKLKELYNTYQETGDLLFKLGNEIKSQPLPQNLQKKAKILKSWEKKTKKESGSFNFFGLFKMQYAAITAAFCLFFVGSFYIDELRKLDKEWNWNLKIASLGEENFEEKEWIAKKTDKEKKLDLIKIKKKRKLLVKKLKEKNIETMPEDESVNMLYKAYKYQAYEMPIKDKKIQSITSKEIQRIILNEYFYFDEKKFLNEISQFIDQLGINDKFETSLKDKNLEKIKFILVENFYEGRCKRIKFIIRPFHEIDSLDLCKINGKYELLSLNIVKTISTYAYE